MKRARFTIIELIVVIVVMMIIISMTVATYQKLVAGKQVDSSAAALSAKLMEARQMAVAKSSRSEKTVGNRQFVALVMPGPNVSISDDKRYSAYRLAIVDYDGSNYTLYKWAEGSKWDFTQPGCTIMEADVDVGIYSVGAFEKTPADDSLTTIGGVDLSELGGGVSVSGVRAVIFSKSGRVRGGSSRYVTLGEATFIGGSWIVPNADTHAENVSCANQITLVVNQFTGGVRYTSVDNYWIHAP